MENIVVEYKSLSGIDVKLTPETVVNQLVKGDGRVTTQEVLMFLRTCQARQLDPFENGEVYLIKYGNAPAQLVMGCNAYLRRADRFPDYRGMECGITVVRRLDGKTEVLQKEGSCVYEVLGEELIGGWCKVFRERIAGHIEETFAEVSLKEYSTGKSNWSNKPATMIQKVAKSQAIRAAYPNEFEGLYTYDEMQAAGAFGDRPEPKKENVVGAVKEKIDDEQRKTMFNTAKNVFGDDCNAKLKAIISDAGFSTTKDITKDSYNAILQKIAEEGEKYKAEIDAETAEEAEFTETAVETEE